jgi:LytS/YehU family sensor histidine kinase
MKTKHQNFKVRLSHSLEWKNLKNLLIANTIIATFIFTLNILVGSENILIIFAVCFIYSFAIGTSIYFTVQLIGVEYIETFWKKYLGFTVVFIFSGWIGTLIGSLFIYFIAPDLITKYLTYMFKINTFFAIVFGAVVTAYFLIRKKLEEIATKLAEKEINEQQLLRLKTKAELESLRAKVNPHFLFNTLNSIASLIHLDPVKAEEMVQKLSHLFRYTLDSSNHELMKLSDELNLIREYLEIEKVRLGERLSYNIEMDNKLSDLYIPGLLIQPLVENSIKHGIAPLKTGGNINVKCYENSDNCYIEVIDTGKGFNEVGNIEGFGLSGIRERLKLFYGDDYHFQILTLSSEQISISRGVRILIRIPIEKMKLKFYDLQNNID